MVEFYDGWETGQTWLLYGDAVATRVTTDPFQGSYCLKMDDWSSTKSAAVYKGGLFDPSEDEYLRLAIKNVSDTRSGEVYLYMPDYSAVCCQFWVDGGGDIRYSDAEGGHFLYAGSLNTWYEFHLVLRWSQLKFDIAVYDRNGNKLAEAKNRPMKNSGPVYMTGHVILYCSILGSGTTYYDGVSLATYLAEITVSDAGIMCTDKMVEPTPATGHWILDTWVRHVRDIYDKTLADDHNIPRLVLTKAKDIESTKQ